MDCVLSGMPRQSPKTCPHNHALSYRHRTTPCPMIVPAGQRAHHRPAIHAGHTCAKLHTDGAPLDTSPLWPTARHATAGDAADGPLAHHGGVPPGKAPAGAKVAPPPRGCKASPKAPAGLTLLTYNVLTTPTVKNQRVPPLLRLLKKERPDVIALQEAAPWG